MKRNKSNERMIQKNVAHAQEKRRARMANQTPNAKAKKWFDRPTYQARSLIRAQGEQMEHNDVLGYLDKRGHNLKGEMQVGQEDS